MATSCLLRQSRRLCCWLFLASTWHPHAVTTIMRAVGSGSGSAVTQLHHAALYATPHRHAYRDLELASSVTGVFTFGAPRFGDQAFCDLLAKRFQGRLFRYVHAADMVCKLPPGLGFSDHCGERFITSFPVKHPRSRSESSTWDAWGKWPSKWIFSEEFWWPSYAL